MADPKLPQETEDFSQANVQGGGYSLSHYEELCKLELRDARQQVVMRPIVAAFYALLLVGQNVVVFRMVAWALKEGKLPDLQLVFTALIAGSLTQTYKISELIVKKLFEPIDYKDKQDRFDHE